MYWTRAHRPNLRRRTPARAGVPPPSRLTPAATDATDRGRFNAPAPSPTRFSRFHLGTHGFESLDELDGPSRAPLFAAIPLPRTTTGSGSRKYQTNYPPASAPAPPPTR